MARSRAGLPHLCIGLWGADAAAHLRDAVWSIYRQRAPLGAAATALDAGCII